MEEGDWPVIYERLEATIQACNQCHEATDHGFIRITAEPRPNPYNQRFDVPWPASDSYSSCSLRRDRSRHFLREAVRHSLLDAQAVRKHSRRRYLRPGARPADDER